MTVGIPALPIPWTAGKAVRDGERDRPDPVGDTMLVQVSRLELVRRRDVARFLVAALRIRRLALRTPGCVGLALRAQPFRRTFWTLSAWDDQGAIGEFMRSDGHRAVMIEYRGRMAGSHFHTWHAMIQPRRRRGPRRAAATTNRSTVRRHEQLARRTDDAEQPVDKEADRHHHDQHPARIG
jgi:hypothetical protein